MIINGLKVPYIEVAYGFARNPSRFSYDLLPRYNGGARIRNRRIGALEMAIPVVYSRRGSEKTWDEIKRELAEILYRNEPSKISFNHGDGKYYLAHVVAIEIAEEHEYVAKGNIVIAGDFSTMYGDDITLTFGDDAEYFTIEGQQPADWTALVEFDSPKSSYTLESDCGNIEINHEFIAGDILKIDYKTRAIRLNGEIIDVGLSLASEWFALAPGYAELSANHLTHLTYTSRYY